MTSTHLLTGLLLLTLVACGGDRAETTAPTPAASGAPAPQEAQAPSAELRDKLRQLAVAAECLRRSDAPNDAVAESMMRLYAEHGVDLDTYAREMGRLGGDASFQAEIQAGLATCSTPPVAIGKAAAEAPAPEAPAPEAPAVEAPAEVEAVGAGDVPAVGAGEVPVDDAVGGAGLDAPVDEPADAGVAGAGEPDAEGIAEPGSPEDPPADTAETGDPSGATPAEEADSTPSDGRPDASGTWTGALRGSVSGTVRVVIRGTRVTSATVTLAGRTVRVQGNLTASGQLTLGGRLNSSDFIRLRGRMNKERTRLTGSWDGVIERKMSRGSLTLSR